MKVVLLIILFTASFLNCECQHNRLNAYRCVRPFLTTYIALYSDSTFLFFSKGETSRRISWGEYKYKNGHLILAYEEFSNDSNVTVSFFGNHEAQLASKMKRDYSFYYLYDLNSDTSHKTITILSQELIDDSEKYKKVSKFTFNYFLRKYW